MPVNPVPPGFHTVTPYLVVTGIAKLIEFVRQAFDAEVAVCSEMPDGRIMHAEIRIGDSMIMMGEANERHAAMPSCLYLYVADTDAWYQRALDAGATSLMAPANQFYGDRNAGVKDLCGNYWWIGTHVEDVPPDELERRKHEFAKSAGLQ